MLCFTNYIIFTIILIKNFCDQQITVLIIALERFVAYMMENLKHTLMKTVACENKEEMQ